MAASDTGGFACSEDCSETKTAVDGGRLTLSWSAGLGLGAGAIGEGSRRSSSHQGFVSVRPAVVSSGGARCKMLSTVSTEGYRQGLIAESRRGAYSVATNQPSRRPYSIYKHRTPNKKREGTAGRCVCVCVCACVCGPPHGPMCRVGWVECVCVCARARACVFVSLSLSLSVCVCVCVCVWIPLPHPLD